MPASPFLDLFRRGILRVRPKMNSVAGVLPLRRDLFDECQRTKATKLGNSNGHQDPRKSCRLVIKRAVFLSRPKLNFRRDYHSPSACQWAATCCLWLPAAFAATRTAGNSGSHKSGNLAGISTTNWPLVAAVSDKSYLTSEFAAPEPTRCQLSRAKWPDEASCSENNCASSL